MSEDINKAVLNGRLTRGSELTYATNGTALCRFSVACNERMKSGEEWTERPSYFDCVLWGRRGEALNQYLQKGQQVSIIARLRQDRWETDGNKRSKIVLHVESLQLLGGRKDSGNSFGGYAPSENPERFEDDIPF